MDAVVVAGAGGEQIYTRSGADRLYRQLIETMSEGALTLSAGSVILYGNVRLAEMLGRPLDQVVGSPLRNHLPPADQQTLDSILARARTAPSRVEMNLKNSEGRLVPVHLSASRLHSEGAALTAGEVWSGRLVNRRKDGTFYEEEATISPVLDEAGKIVNYVAVKRDVTREVALEAQNRQAAKMEAVGQLAGGVAHDFNNQLTVVLGWTEMLRRELPPDHPFLASLQEIETAANRSAVLTRQLLTFSRQQAIAPVALDVNAGIADSMKMLGRLIGEDINLRFTRQPDLWRVFMDPGQWDQVLVNLVVNARDAIAGTGHIFIEAANRMLREADGRDQPDFVSPGDYVVVTFRDDGSGMTPEIQRHIFEPFFTTKGPGQGTGLGLATVYGIVKQNNGAIAVHSAPGQGTAFTIYLPRAQEAASAAVEGLGTQMPTGAETVLLVEDEEGVMNPVCRTLVKLGYHVLAVPSPAEALRLVASHAEAIQLLLTDVIMPGMSGKVLAGRIRKLRPGIRILFMSGYSTEILEKQGHLPAGLHVLRKPFSSGILAQHVRAALDAPAGSTPL